MRISLLGNEKTRWILIHIWEPNSMGATLAELRRRHRALRSSFSTLDGFHKPSRMQ